MSGSRPPGDSRGHPRCGRGAGADAGRARPVEGEGRRGDVDRAGLGSSGSGVRAAGGRSVVWLFTRASGWGVPSCGFVTGRLRWAVRSVREELSQAGSRTAAGPADARGVQGDADAAARAGRPRAGVVPGVSHARSRAGSAGKRACARSAAGMRHARRQTIEAFVAGDERYAPARPRPLVRALPGRWVPAVGYDRRAALRGVPPSLAEDSGRPAAVDASSSSRRGRGSRRLTASAR